MRLIATIALLLLAVTARVSAQDLQYYFVDDTYQRSYTNPALTNDNTIHIASGIAGSLGTDGPTFGSIAKKNEAGIYTINLEEGLADMKERPFIYGSQSVHTLDASVDLKVFRISAGHAWKAHGLLEYTRDLAEIATYGNAPYIGETKSLGPAYEYINYNELYLGIQKYVGPISVAARIKRLSGVQGLQTTRSKIDVTTDEEFYALTVDSDYTVNSAGNTLQYFDIDSLDVSLQGFSFDNFLSGNSGWAFDLGASFDLGERLELSLGLIDIGSINWDTNATQLSSKKVQTFDGIDLTDYILTDDDIVLEDSIKALLDFEEQSATFSTALPRQVYVGGRLQLSDTYTVGALIHTTTYQDKTRTAIALNATATYGVARIGLQYTARSESAFNIGANAALHIGPVIGFMTFENILALTDLTKTRYAAVRAGISVSI